MRLRPGPAAFPVENGKIDRRIWELALVKVSVPGDGGDSAGAGGVSGGVAEGRPSKPPGGSSGEMAAKGAWGIVTGGLIRACTFGNNEPVRLDLERQATPR